MSLRRYDGHSPSNVSKDAKYTVTADGQVRLVYRVDTRTKELLTTSQHPELVKQVNAVKLQLTGSLGGVFYINEFGDVLVPDGAGGSYWAGHYEDTLAFAFERSTLSPRAPAGLKAGECWPGPHPGVAYVLRAGGHDVKYERRNGSRITEVRLSDEVTASDARATAARIAAVKGTAGGRFYINERREMFAPVASNNYAEFVYIGHLEDSAWFEAPDGYDRP